jgi:hypothetical protein
LNIYEPVLVGSVEDALLATILNGKIAGLPDGVPADRDAVGALRHRLTTVATRTIG